MRIIDVIIPTFNRATTLKRSISSVLAQTHRDLQLFVVDDGSTDDTRELIKPFLSDPRVCYLYQKNGGVSSARNLGIKSSRNEWIAFLDSDDEWLPQKLQIQLKQLEAAEGASFIHTNEIWIRNGVRVNQPRKFDKSNTDIFKRSLQTCLISPSTVLIHRDLILKHECFDESFAVCEDYDLWLKILSRQEICFEPQALTIKYGGHPDQLSTSHPAMDYWRIKSLVALLSDPILSNEKKILVLNEINDKSQVLIEGFKKHHNLEKLSEIEALLRKISLIHE